MSETQRPEATSRLDRAIDDALGRSVRQPAPAGMRARVAARLSPSCTSRRAIAAWAALAAAVVLVLAVVVRRPVTPSGPRAEVRTPIPAPSRVVAEEASGPSAAAKVSVGGAATAVATPIGHVANARPAVVDKEPLPELDRVDVTRLEMRALEIEPLPAEAPRPITPLKAERVVVAPLSAEPGDSSPPEDTP